ncbi:MAG: WD40 repeat domain-containing protein, partial [Gammaproteobacteria bacterium]|nr:WD40 repeat domain-containing protein [Gammaproteobacteria bacterium]
MNSFTHVKSELKLLLSAALVFILASCTYSEPQTSINFSAFLPSSQQLGLKVTDIPSALSVYHHYPNAVDKEKARQLLKDRKVPDFTSYIQGATGAIIPVASQNHDRFSPTADMTNEQLLDAFDPFYIGAGNVAQNATTSGCGGTRSGEPNITFQYGNSWCLMGVIKFALHNAVTNYDNFHNILTSIIENLSTGNDIKGVESLYTNPSVQTLHASGLSIAVFFDDCVNHRDAVVADPEGLAMCTGEGDNAVYHRVKIYPLIPTSTSVTVDSVIGKMEWIQRPNSSVKAKMAISVSLMSPGDPAANGANPGFAGSQHQFELETDAEGKFQSIIIKKETRIICCTSFSVDHQWDANVVRITRLPGAGGNPGLWAVEGSILYNLEMGFNPLSPLVYEFQFGAHQPDKRVYFAGVTEDVFTGGRSVHKAIMADAGGGGLLDFNLYTPDQWDSELHLWAAYKKLLKMNFSKQHYEIAHGMNEPPINLWDAATGAQYLPSGTRTTQEQKSIELSPDGQTILVSSRNGLSLYTATENMYGNRNISLIGSCDPFPETTIQTNAKFNPNPSYPNQVLVADATYYAAVENTHEARMVDISDIANGNCPTIRSFFHPDSGTTGQGLYRVDFSPDGSKLMVEAIWDGKFKVWNTLDNTAPIAQITPSNFSTFSARFDSTGNRLISSHYDQSTYIMDIATGSVLKLHDDIGTPISSSHIEYAALENPNFPNQIISTRNGLLSYNIPGKIFRWDISAWDPLQGNATYSASISPYLLQDISASDVNGTLANVSGGNIDSSGSRLVIDSNVNSTVYAINISTGAIEAPITTLTPQRPYRPRTSYGNLFSPIFSQDGSQLYHLLRVNYNSCYGCTYDLQDHIVLQNVSAGAPPAPFKDGHVGRATMA